MKKVIIGICIIILFILIAIYIYLGRTTEDEVILYRVTIIHCNIVPEKSALEKALENRNGETLESLPILMYHAFYDATESSRRRNSNWMEISDFEEQMRYLAEQEYYFPTWEEVYGFVNGTKELPIRSIVVTIDDGEPSFFYLAVPILERYNIKATSFVITSWIEEYVIRSYESEILIFESHSHDMHRPGRDERGAMVTATREELYNDLARSREMLNGGIVFCYPFGHYNEFVKQMLEEMGYKLAVTTIMRQSYTWNGAFKIAKSKNV